MDELRNSRKLNPLGAHVRRVAISLVTPVRFRIEAETLEAKSSKTVICSEAAPFQVESELSINKTVGLQKLNM